ncbi:hypothetical protein ACP70R_009258 [Stipagrostis hirtigluma subsp. patula]
MPTPRTLRRRAQRQRAKDAARGMMADIIYRLPPELQAKIHRRGLPFLTRLAFASICGASGHLLKPEAPWLVLPGTVEDGDEKATLISIADGKAAKVRTPDPAMRGHVVLGSGGGWLVTADARGALRMANPATGAQTDMPAITTIPFLHSRNSAGDWIDLHVEPFLQFRFGGAPPPDDNTCSPIPSRTNTLTAAQMRQWFYRKVVLAASPRPENYTAMLIVERPFSVPAFATADDPKWRMAPSHDGVEDAVHHDGGFYSITYSGVVEAWNRDAETGEFTSTPVAAPRLAVVECNDNKLLRKYLAVAPDGRLMAVLKATRKEEHNVYRSRNVTRVFFTVHVLDEAGERWEEEPDIGDAALFVGVNGSLCISTREHPGIIAGCVYYTDDEIGEATVRHELRRPWDPYSRYRDVYGKDDNEELRFLGVYSLRNGTVERIADLEERRCWPPAAWVTPSFL